jgi:hypothetical protein
MGHLQRCAKDAPASSPAVDKDQQPVAEEEAEAHAVQKDRSVENPARDGWRTTLQKLALAIPPHEPRLRARFVDAAVSLSASLVGPWGLATKLDSQ